MLLPFAAPASRDEGRDRVRRRKRRRAGVIRAAKTRNNLDGEWFECARHPGVLSLPAYYPCWRTAVQRRPGAYARAVQRGARKTYRLRGVTQRAQRILNPGCAAYFNGMMRRASGAFRCPPGGWLAGLGRFKFRVARRGAIRGERMSDMASARQDCFRDADNPRPNWPTVVQ